MLILDDMIADLFFSIVFWLVNGLINMLPASQGIPADAFVALRMIGGDIGMFNGVFPTSTLLLCLTIVFGGAIGIYGFRTLKWVISHLPWIGGRG